MNREARKMMFGNSFLISIAMIMDESIKNLISRALFPDRLIHDHGTAPAQTAAPPPRAAPASRLVWAVRISKETQRWAWRPFLLRNLRPKLCNNWVQLGVGKLSISVIQIRSLVSNRGWNATEFSQFYLETVYLENMAEDFALCGSTHRANPFFKLKHVAFTNINCSVNGLPLEPWLRYHGETHVRKQSLLKHPALDGPSCWNIPRCCDLSGTTGKGASFNGAEPLLVCFLLCGMR